MKYAVIALLVMTLSVPALAHDVDVELVIATDVSASISGTEGLIQRQGVAAAFRSQGVVNAIRAGRLGKIGAAYMEWSDSPSVNVPVGWTVIGDHASAVAFADAIEAAPRITGSGTAIGTALVAALNLIETNNLEGARRVVDVSGDGLSNSGLPLRQAREMVIAAGVIINGLPVLTDEADRPDIDAYYRACVIGGIGAFAISARGFQEFAQVIRRKFVLEISQDRPVLTRVAFAPMSKWTGGCEESAVQRYAPP